MQVRLLKSELDNLVDVDAGDHTWWVEERIENTIESLLEMINDKLFEKDQIIIVPDERYLKCTCQFKKKGEYVTPSYSKFGGYTETYVHTSYCKEHEDENPELYTIEEHMKNCPECKMESEN